MTTLKLLRYQWRDAIRSRWLLVYTLLFLAATEGLFRFSGAGDRVALGLMNLVLLLVPLVGIVLGTMHVYQSREFAELMLTQPIRRSSLFKSLYFGLTLPLCAGLAVGIGLPFLYHGAMLADASAYLMLIAAGAALTFIFTALAFSIAFRYDDRVKGIGLSLGVWMFLAIVYDGLVLVALGVFQDYPLEKAALVLMGLNPIDLARVSLLLTMDAAALMGFTGAVFRSVFGGYSGVMAAFVILAAWAVVPFMICRRIFERKHF